MDAGRRVALDKVALNALKARLGDFNRGMRQVHFKLPPPWNT